MNKNTNGFTIVELLIVVVVIAILAAITIVSYNGIQAQAKNSAAQTSAKTVAKKAELYYTEVGNYPLGMSALTGAAASATYNVSGIVYVGLTNDSSPNSVIFYVCGSGSPASAAAITSSNVTGGRIYYRDYKNSTNKNEAYGVVSGAGIACFGRN